MMQPLQMGLIEDMYHFEVKGKPPFFPFLNYPLIRNLYSQNDFSNLDIFERNLIEFIKKNFDVFCRKKLEKEREKS